MDRESVLKIFISFGIEGKAAEEATDKIMGLKRETQGAGEAAHHANAHHREMHLLFLQMNEVVPGLGHAMHAAFLGEVGAVLLLAEAVRVAMEKLKAFDDELKKQAEWSSKPIVDKWLEVQKAIAATAEDVAKFKTSLKDAATDMDPIATSAKLAKEAFDAELESQKKLIEAQYNLTEATIKYAAARRRASGLDDNQQQKELDALEAQKAAALEALDNRKTAFEFQEKQRQQSNYEIEQARLVNQLNAQRPEYEKQKQELDDLKARIAHGQAAVGPYGTDSEEVKKIKQEGNEALEAIKMGRIWRAADLPLIAQRLKDAQARQAVDEADYADAQKHLQELTDKYQGTIDSYDRMQKQVDDYTTKLADLNREMPTLKKNFELSQSTTAATDAADVATRRTKAAGELTGSNKQIFDSAVSALDILTHMKEQTGFSPQDYLQHGTPQQRQWILGLQAQVQALEDVESAVNENGQAMIKLLQSIVQNHGSLTAFAQRLQAQLDQQNAQLQQAATANRF
ncbi:MAG: hypothetical protein KGL39_02935 [Patescibacteria group bacterium]|nr:hypothetical protein [Patescibacteria group bacterium]